MDFFDDECGAVLDLTKEVAAEQQNTIIEKDKLKHEQVCAETRKKQSVLGLQILSRRPPALLSLSRAARKELTTLSAQINEKKPKPRPRHRVGSLYGGPPSPHEHSEFYWQHVRQPSVEEMRQHFEDNNIHAFHNVGVEES